MWVLPVYLCVTKAGLSRKFVEEIYLVLSAIAVMFIGSFSISYLVDFFRCKIIFIYDLYNALLLEYRSDSSFNFSSMYHLRGFLKMGGATVCSSISC